MKRIILILLMIIALLAMIIAMISVQQQENLVVNVVDGDTFDLATGERVRLIGINTPEKNEYYYEEAKQFLEDLILDKIVNLEKDISEKDKYNRLLKYVYIDGTMVNIMLVENGYAAAVEYPPDLRYASQLRNAENDAIANELGIWYTEKEGDDLCGALGCQQGTNYVGSINSNKYHSCDSRFARSILPENLVCFSTEASALEQGYESSE